MYLLLLCRLYDRMSSCGLFLFAIQKLSSVLDEVESLKPEFLRRVDELKKAHSRSRLLLPDAPELSLFGSEISSLERPAANRNSYLSVDMKRV